MPHRLELVGKTKATVQAIDILSLKMGQTDVQPAVCLSLKVSLPNSRLSMLSATLRDFLYENDTGKTNAQSALDGIEVVSDKPNLTAEASALGALHWEYEQTGCTLRIYNGVSGHGDIKLADGTVRKLKIDPKEGGTVDHYFQFYTADVDAETIGELGILKSLERDIELTAPEIISQQKDIEDDEQGDGTTTPEAALAGAVGAGADDKRPDTSNPLPGQEVGAGVTVTHKKSRRAATAGAA
jgi:hypothetical protein